MSQLVLYHSALDSEPGRAMQAFVGAPSEATFLPLVRAVYALAPLPGPTDDPWQNHLLQRILLDENAFTTARHLAPHLVDAARHDLRLLQEFYRMTGEACRSLVGDDRLPTWGGWTGPPRFESPAYTAMARRLAESTDWADLAEALDDYHRVHGTGVVSQSWYLRWDGTQLQGVADPNRIEIDHLVGLADQKRAVLANTEAFVQGAGGNNLLLYGPRGTGKSSLVRSLAGRYGEQGLRLVEVDDLPSLGGLFRLLKERAQRFILFFDDLSFDEDDADYRAFKSTLEGALERRPANVLLYATTNRRHMIPERWADRNSPETAEVHGQDAMEEKLSLADRFGRQILFARPNQQEYLAIVERLAALEGLAISREELHQEALRWALWQNSPSGRTARQFIDDLVGRGIR